MDQLNLTDRDRLAMKAVELAKALVLADCPFLSGAVGRLRVVLGRYRMPMATDGFKLGVDSALVCGMFKTTEEPPKHDLLHSVLHCVFLHPYAGFSIDERLWDLACDIVVERIVLEICGSRGGTRAKRIESVIGEIEKETGSCLSAERMYRELRSGKWADDVDEWADLFAADDHSPWYPASAEGEAAGERGNGEGLCSEMVEQALGADRLRDSDEGNGDFSLRIGGDSDESGGAGGTGGRGISGPSASKRGDGQNGEAPVNEWDEPGTGQGRLPGSSSVDTASVDRGANIREARRSDRNAEMEEWQRVARTLAVNLQTYSKGRAKGFGGLIDGLEDSSRPRADYADFLRRFAIPGEVLKVSDEEFDYVLYTYGLKVYGNIPLVEPLEYREEKRIREFVIVIDTSGSVWGDIVRRFVDTTFDVLKSTEAFFERVHVRIIQCDAEVRSDDMITNLAELREWGRRMRLYGCGGTDFRPAFDYVDKLIEEGEFVNLGGLVCFTDGMGVYPERMPAYKTAFVFYGDAYVREAVPSWVAQMELDDNGFDGRGGSLHGWS